MYQGHFGIPGSTTANFTFANEFLWGGDSSRIRVLGGQTVVSGAARDAANDPTTVLRPGLVMGQVAATKLWKEYDPAATDGSQFPAGILAAETLATDPITGVNTDRVAPVYVQAPVKASNLMILGAAMVGHTGEFVVRKALAKAGFVFDDDASNQLAGVNQRIETKAANYTVVDEDNGKLFQAITGAVTFTLPTRKAGLAFEFLNTVDAAMIINGGASHVIAVDTLAGTSVTFNTADQMIGAHARFECVNVNGTLKWIYTLLSTGTTGTVA